MLVRDVTEKNSVLTNSCSLLYFLHFVSALAPKEIARNKVVSKFELSGVPSIETVDELHN